jgi:hypothetical protein
VAWLKRTKPSLAARTGPLSGGDYIGRACSIDMAKETAMMTDEGGHYFTLGEHFASHESVSHKADEYVRGSVHTNTVEGYYSVFKRGMKGVYQHCSEKHLHRYLSEFDFCYSNRVALGINDIVRAERAIKSAEGRRLTYQQPH